MVFQYIIYGCCTTLCPPYWTWPGHFLPNMYHMSKKWLFGQLYHPHFLRTKLCYYKKAHLAQNWDFFKLRMAFWIVNISWNQVWHQTVFIQPWDFFSFTFLEQEEAKAEKEEGIPDKEGWVKVTRKGRKPGLPWTEAANLRTLEREKRKRARKELLNFYAWQHRETKREREFFTFRELSHT